MNYRMIRRFVSKILLIEAAFMVPPLAISLYCGETEAVWAFLASIGIMLALPHPKERRKLSGRGRAWSV